MTAATATAHTGTAARHADCATAIARVAANAMVEGTATGHGLPDAGEPSSASRITAAAESATAAEGRTTATGIAPPSASEISRAKITGTP